MPPRRREEEEEGGGVNEGISTGSGDCAGKKRAVVGKGGWSVYFGGNVRVVGDVRGVGGIAVIKEEIRG